MNRHKNLAWQVGGVVVGFWMIVLLYVQGNSASSVKEMNQSQTIGRAATLPTSDNVVSLQIIVGGQVVKAAQREGGLIRIEQEGKIIGVSPHIRDIDENKISVDILRITKIVRNGVYVGEAITMVQSLDVDKLAAVVTDSAPSLSIQVEGIKMEADASSEAERTGPLLERYGKVRKQDCCIQCGNLIACGCAVSLSCGSCCTGLCCDNGAGDRPGKNKSN